MTSIVSYYNDVIQELNNTNLNDLYDTVLEYAANTTFAGSLIIGAPVGNNTLVGYFTDTARSGPPGSDGITIVSNTYAISQYTDTAINTPSPNVVSLQYETIVGGFGNYAPEYFQEDYTVLVTDAIVLQENYTIMTEIADNILSRMVTGYGVGSYYLGNTIPTGDTGVWQNLGRLEDTLNNFTELNTAYFLWKKLSTGNAKTLLKPLKLNTSELIEFTDTELNNILYYVEQRFLTTGVGTYVLDTTAPVTGTWSNVGVITDFIRTTQTDSYTNEFSSAYTAEYNLDTPYLTDYTGDFDGAVFTEQPLFDSAIFNDIFNDTFTLPYTADFIGYFDGDVFTAQSEFDGVDFSGTFNNLFAVPYTVDYVGDDAANFTGPFPVTYSGPAAFINPDASSFIGSTPVGYQGPASYTGENSIVYTRDGTTYSGPVTYVGGNSAFLASAPVPYTGFIIYTGDNGVPFVAYVPYTRAGTKYYVGPTGNFLAQLFFTGFVYYSGPGNFGGPAFFSGSITYSGPANFTNPNASNFTSAAVNYSGVGVFTTTTATFVGFIPVNYAGPVAYTGDNAANFTGFVPTVYSGPATFNNIFNDSYTADYIGPSYTSTYTGAGETYTSTFIGVFNTTFSEPYTADYTGPDYTSTYTGTGGDYTSTFSSVFTAEYTSTIIYSQVYTTLYETLYEKETVAPALQQNPSVTLWVRIG